MKPPNVSKAKTAAAVLFSLLPGGCASPIGGDCPPLPAYSSATQRLAAVELRGAPKGSALARMIVDYGKMRDACRVGTTP